MFQFQTPSHPRCQAEWMEQAPAVRLQRELRRGLVQRLEWRAPPEDRGRAALLRGRKEEVHGAGR